MHLSIYLIVQSRIRVYHGPATTMTRGYRKPSRAILTTTYLYLAAAYHFFLSTQIFKNWRKTNDNPTSFISPLTMAKFPGSNRNPVVIRSPVVLGPMPPPCDTPWRRHLCRACRRLGCLRCTPRGDLLATAPFRGARAIVIFRHAATFGHQDCCARPPSAASSQRRYR